uniref:Protein three rows n=1 Tax=Stomoxys calcitrans TaxID=35570 RepID=A0A1I8PXL2_STOCA
MNAVIRATDGYSVLLQSPLLLITSHAFKVIDKMDCLSETSQEIQTLLYRFKQASVSACTGNQANTCIKIYEKFLKIKNKLPESEWPLLLKRLYKAVAKCMVKNPQIIRETQMCYIASLLQLPSEIDFCQIRGQITLYYRDSFTEEQKQNENGEGQICSTVPPHEHCLVHMLQHSTNTLRPHLKVARKRLLHWFEVQHIVKYYKTNTNLMKSVILCSQSFYDLVITTRATKLPTSDVPKFISIHKYLRDKLDLNRLEQLTYGHTCTKVLLEFQMSRSQKGSLESQEFAEDQLERLLMHKEMESLTICTELQYVKWAYDAYVAFEQFFLKFDEEQISSDEALIDWEAIIEDLGAVAQFLEMSSYTEYASHVWMLHYKISQLLLDDISSLKALTFFCENSSFYEENERDINLDKEIELHLPTITNSLENIESLHRRKQNLILLVTLHVGFYYIRCSKYTFGQMLLQYVEEKHNALPDRLGAYDLITANLDVIRYKLLWRHYHHAEKDLSSHVVKNVLLNQSLIGEIEQILERMKKFVCVASEALSYHKLIFNMVQDLAECSANRLYENVVISLYAAACKCALLNSFALRMAQVMSTWMHINLQMEYIDNAQTKLKIIEYIMGIKSLKELCGNSTPTTASTALKYCDKPSENISEAIPYNAVGMEATRRLVPVQLSPIKTGKLQLRPDAVNTNLKSYFKYKIDTKTLPNNELLGWTYFTIACLNARLYFLVEDYVQLEPFYEKGRQWIKMRENNFNKMYFKNVELMAVQHFANFLRASRQQKAAIECLEYGVDLCGTKKFDIDVVFRINFRLQMFEAQRELDRTKETKLPCDMFEKAWKYNMTPEKLIYNREKVKSSLKDQMMQLAMTSHKKNTAVSGSLSTRKNKTQTSRSSSSSPEVKDQLNERLNFRICEDSIEIIDSDSESGKYKSKEHYTPKIPRKTSKTSSTKKLSKQMNAQRYENQLSDSKGLQESTVFPTAPLKSSSIRGAAVSSSAAVENFKAKENIPHNDVDLLVRMKNLELSDKPKQKKGKIVLSKSPMDNKADTSVIMIEDSPIIRPVEMSASKPRGRPRKNKSVVTEVVKIVESTARPTRRRRNLVNENLELNCCPSSNEVLITSSSSSTSTPKITSSAIKTKKRQKI